MTLWTIGIVAAGLVAALLLSIAAGIDTTGAIILSFLVATGVLAVSVASKAGRGLVGPATCRECGGVISAQAPHCKHCGATF